MLKVARQFSFQYSRFLTKLAKQISKFYLQCFIELCCCTICKTDIKQTVTLQLFIKHVSINIIAVQSSIVGTELPYFGHKLGAFINYLSDDVMVHE